MVRTLYAGNGDDSWWASRDTGTGAFAESGEAWDVRCSSPPSSVAVMGVGMSLLGASMSVLAGLECASPGDCAWTGDSWGGGVGCCIGTSGADSTLLAAVMLASWFNARVVVMRDSSGGQVVRPAMLSCSETVAIASSGVGIVRGAGCGESLATKELITHETKQRWDGDYKIGHSRITRRGDGS